MNHPYKTPGEVAKLLPIVLFSPKLARDLTQKSQPIQVAKKLAKEEKEKRWAKKQEKAEQKKAKDYWHDRVEKSIKEAARAGCFSSSIRDHYTSTNIDMVIQYGKSIGWDVTESGTKICISWEKKKKRPLLWPCGLLPVLLIINLLFVVFYFML